MKECKKCKIKKSLEEFHKDKSRKDGRKNDCKDCAKQRAKIWRRDNKERDIYKALQRKKKYRLRNQKFIASYLKTHPCVVCGEDDIVVLEFDHLRGKKHNICTMVAGDATGYALKTIIEEVEKCQVLCSNCHKRKTSKDQNWWILKY